MKRLKRDPETFEPIELFSSIGLQYNYNLQNTADRDDFVQRVTASLTFAQQNQRVLFGKRVESSFPMVLGALGKVSLIKQEDSGTIFSSDNTINIPDYRVITDTGEQYLVEVKNCHSDNFEYEYPFRNEYLASLQVYADMSKLPLKLAIYFSHFNQWVLLDPTSLIKKSKRCVTTFINAVAKNEMGTFGDLLIGTKPKLEFVIVNDADNTGDIQDNGETVILIKDVKLKCAGIEITDNTEKNIAFYLTRYGNWVESSVTPVVIDNRVESIVFTFEPEDSSENNGFDSIGYLSSMISSAYREYTIEGDKVIAVDANVEPSQFNIGIPENYNSKTLPLWRFQIQPNFETDIVKLSSPAEDQS
ncbi:PD-(D/E)XK nuclease superfamily protein [Vibrio crassostreae]|uniref:hypothetical protein n=1 Tax=Vibrio crassostreae TaxID=246167 RepID=UPI001B300CAB|nr:hypothetical protein [Vibrio crassostreae]CAK1816547.1 PD-(D/E)XK nuclease superfamily protein [Vibrio crassostreae]CAK1816722.1 PD-(D/E)XK nuclease superfamily protein [Vibrio crassostreae]CAK1878188.1 PD-(D/E)XK nuclease superfamily protein [Vibrio crassostreae]CAK1881253.1 PD-(D/E)XK nuclease superfamily protein [Vibrio crassostreae]CAK1891011.1 PD-(D/E)XK nuclease superfamily protein [Vibrio crassostreae]